MLFYQVLYCKKLQKLEISIKANTISKLTVVCIVLNNCQLHQSASECSLSKQFHWLAASEKLFLQISYCTFFFCFHNARVIYQLFLLQTSYFGENCQTSTRFFFLEMLKIFKFFRRFFQYSMLIRKNFFHSLCLQYSVIECPMFYPTSLCSH